MSTKTIINKTIKELKETSNDANERLSKYDNDLVTINEMLDIVKDLNSDIVGYNPDRAFELLKENNLEIYGIKSIFTDVQNIVEYSIKNDEEVNLDDYDNYRLKMTELKNNLSLLKELIEKKLIDAKQKVSNEEDVENLEKILDIITENKKKYITEDMLASLYKTVLIKHSLDDLIPLYNDLFKTRNFELKIEEKADASSIDDVVDLFTEILPNLKINDYLESKKDQILKNVDLENARKIIGFLKSKKIINYFDRILLVKIVTQVDYDSVVETYNELKENVPNNQALASYCCDSASSIWIKGKKASKNKRNSEENESK